MHPEVSAFSAFKYKPGKPDRTKKVQRFFSTEEAKMLKTAQKEAEQESMMLNKNAKDSKQKRSRIYFDSIKSKVPKLETTEELKDRRKVLEEKKAKGGNNLIIRKGSGNLAAAIGLYKSGQDLEKLAVVKRITVSLSREFKFGALSVQTGGRGSAEGGSDQGAVSPGRISGGQGNISPLLSSLAQRRSPTGRRSTGGGLSPMISPHRLQRGMSMVITEQTNQSSESSSDSEKSSSMKTMRQVDMIGYLEEQYLHRKHTHHGSKQSRKLRPGETVKEVIDRFFERSNAQKARKNQ